MDNLIKKIKLTKLEMSDFTEQERIEIIKLKSDLITLSEKDLIEKYSSTNEDFIKTIDILHNMYDSGNLTFLIMSNLVHTDHFKLYKFEDFVKKIIMLINSRRFDIKNKKEVYPKINDLIEFFNQTENMDENEKYVRAIDLIVDDMSERNTKIPGLDTYIELIQEDGKVIDYLTTNAENYCTQNLSTTICSIPYLYKLLPETFNTNHVKNKLNKLDESITNNENYSYVKSLYEYAKQYIKNTG